jgi:hypothetical protein
MSINVLSKGCTGFSEAVMEEILVDGIFQEDVGQLC